MIKLWEKKTGAVIERLPIDAQEILRQPGCMYTDQDPSVDAPKRKDPPAAKPDAAPETRVTDPDATQDGGSTATPDDSGKKPKRTTPKE